MNGTDPTMRGRLGVTWLPLLVYFDVWISILISFETQSLKHISFEFKYSYWCLIAQWRELYIEVNKFGKTIIVAMLIDCLYLQVLMSLQKECDLPPPLWGFIGVLGWSGLVNFQHTFILMIYSCNISRWGLKSEHVLDVHFEMLDNLILIHVLSKFLIKCEKGYYWIECSTSHQNLHDLKDFDMSDLETLSINEEKPNVEVHDEEEVELLVNRSKMFKRVF